MRGVQVKAGTFCGIEALESRTLLSAPAATGFIHTTARLSKARGLITPLQVGNLILFAGGNLWTPDGHGRPFDVVDIYNATTGRWKISRLSQARDGMAAAAVGHYAVFAGGMTFFERRGRWVATNIVDILNTATGRWSTGTLSQASVGARAAGVGRFIVIAGGSRNGTETSAVDIFDTATGRWSTGSLSQPRVGMAAVVVGTRAIFAGGAYSTAEQDFIASSAVDIFDGSTGTWSTATLSAARNQIGAAVVGDLAIFAGGVTGYSGAGWPEGTTAVDINNSRTGQWSTTKISQARAPVGATVAKRVIFAGGQILAQPTPLVDIYNQHTGQWSTAQLSETRNRAGATTVGTCVIVAGGTANVSDTVDLFNVESLEWSVLKLARARMDMLVELAGDTAVIAGGWEANSISNLVDLFTLDRDAPMATPWPRPVLTIPETSCTFTVTYHDRFRVDSSTLDGNDIIVTGSNGFSAPAQLIAQARGKHGSTRVATYAIRGPGGSWDAADNGVYTIHLQGGQVLDIAGNAAVSVRLGRFRVAIPTASAAALPQVAPFAAPFASVRRIDDLFAEQVESAYSDAGGGGKAPSGTQVS